MGVQDEAERVEVGSLEEWSGWLARHHAARSGAWLVLVKRRTGRQPFDYEAAVVEALRFGWIDSTHRTIDEDRSMIWFCPRKPGSGWSRSNKERIARLREEGRLEPAGAAAVEAAQRNGAWSLLDDVEALVVPRDLEEALGGHPGAREGWELLTRSVRQQHLLALVQAKRPATRERRVRAAVDAAVQRLR